MTTATSLHAITAFWAAHLGCERTRLSQPCTTVVRNGPDLADHHGATVWCRSATCVLAVPASWDEHVSARLARQPAATVLQATRPRPVFGAAVDRVIGPAWIRYADPATFGPRPLGGAPVDRGRPARAWTTGAACGPTAWAHSGIDPARPPVIRLQASWPPGGCAPTSMQVRLEYYPADPENR